tara:strand:- start:2020 stop:4212 length:2193 start_codon:yes stop_codon:yes gene_type:complete
MELAAIGTKQTKMAEEKEQSIQEQIKKSNQEPATTWSAGGLYASATALKDLVQATDQMIAQLANADDPSPCKKRLEDAKVPLTPKEQEAQLWEDMKGCNPFKENFSKDDDAAGVAAGILASLSDVLLTTKYDIIACVKDQMEKFFAVIPVQYYLLILLQGLAKELGNSKIIEEKVSGPCGELVKQTTVFENYLPELDLPKIPPIPYIPIPDLTKILEQVIIKSFCFAFCVVSTQILREISEAMFAVDDMFVEFGDGKLPDLEKVDINPYISDQTIEEAYDRKLTTEKNIATVRDFISYIQGLSFVKQQEMVFLLMGSAECKILDTILATQLDEKFRQQLATSDTPSIQHALKTIRGSKDSSNFTFKNYSSLGLNTDKKIIDFFSFLGTSVNTLDLINDSRANLCLPDVCEVTDENLNAITTAAQKLCDLLNPPSKLPPLPMGDLMSAIGADDIISDQLSTVAEDEYRKMTQLLGQGASPPYLYEWLLPPSIPLNDVTDQDSGQAIRIIKQMVGVSTDSAYKVEVTKEGIRLGDFTATATPKIFATDETANIDIFAENLKKYWIPAKVGNISFQSSNAGPRLFIEPMTFTSQALDAKGNLADAYWLLILQIIRELFPVQKVWANIGSLANAPDDYSLLPDYSSPPAVDPETGEAKPRNFQWDDGFGRGYKGRNRYPKDILKKDIQALFKDSTYDVEKQATNGPDGESQNDVLVLKHIKEGFLGKGELKVVT